MAKLVKASTARKRAEAVDKAQLQIDRIAEDVAYVAGQGDLSYATRVPVKYEKEIVGALEKAGYSIRYPEHEWILAAFGTEKPKAERNWFQKLFGASTEDINELYVPMSAARHYEEVVISWGEPDDLTAEAA